MGFRKSLNHMDLHEFRPGIRSTAEFSDKLVMACMEIGPKKNAGHQHPFEQCGIVVEGKIEMFIGDTLTAFWKQWILIHSCWCDTRMENL